PRAVSAFVGEEVTSIANEFVANTLQHSGARSVDIAVNYGRKSLGLRFCDDGSGIDPDILKRGRDGHFGLAGMRERAARIGAKLELASTLGGGVVVALNVPAALAYAPAARGAKVKPPFETKHEPR